MTDIDYGELYGVKPGEKDFSGAISRALETLEKATGTDAFNLEKYAKLIAEYKAKHPEKKAVFEKEERLRKASGKLVVEFNKRLRDDENYPDKDEVRKWFGIESNKLIAEGASSFNFLYPEFIGPIETIEKIYGLNN